MTTKEILDALKAFPELCEKATPGPWRRFLPYPEGMDDPIHGADVRVCQQGNIDGKRNVCVCCLALMGKSDGNGGWTKETRDQWIDDAEFIASARILAPVLWGMVQDLIEAHNSDVPEAVHWHDVDKHDIGRALARPDVQAMMGRGGRE